MAQESDVKELPNQSSVEEQSAGRDTDDQDTTQPTEHGASAPSVGEQRCCTESAEWRPVSPQHDVNVMDEKLRPVQTYVEYLLNKADEYQAHLIHRRDRLQVEGLRQVVPTFLKSCYPLFSYLEHTARSCLPHRRSPLPRYIRTRLLQLSEQLCSRVEELILTYASYNFLSLEETNPLSISQFFIGHCQVNHIRVSIFRYCSPAPFQPRPSCQLHKLMRWNVERVAERGRERGGEEERGRERGGGGEEEQGRERGGEEEQGRERGPRGGEEERGRWSSTEYYFLCYEEVTREGEWGGEEESRSEGERGEERRRRRGTRSRGREGQKVKMWSIGQWVQTYPTPHTDDLYEWILCGVPRGQYQQLFQLGATEPSTCSATDCLLEALLSHDGQ